MIKNLVKSFEKELARDKKKPKRLFSYINSNCKVRPVILTVRNRNNLDVTDQTSIANVLNEQFASVFVNDESIISPNFPRRALNSTLNTINVDVDIVEKYLSNLDANNTWSRQNSSICSEKVQPRLCDSSSHDFSKVDKPGNCFKCFANS